VKIRGWTHGSPSQCKTFKACGSKWYIQKILGVKDPQTEAQRMGVVRHDKMDGYMKGEREVPSDPIIQVLLEHLPEPHEVNPTDSEYGFKLFLPGAPVPMVGFIDLREVWRRLITDYKFRSSFTYIVEPEGLRQDFQSLTYSMVGVDHPWVGDDEVRGKPATVIHGVQPVEPISFRHLSSRTRERPKAHESLVTFSPQELHDSVPFLVETLQEMQEWSTCKDLSRVPFNTGHCDAYRGCPFRGRCTKLGRLDYSQNLFGGMGKVGIKDRLKGGLKKKPKPNEEEPGMTKKPKKTPGFASKLKKKPGAAAPAKKAPPTKPKTKAAPKKAPAGSGEVVTEGWFTFTHTSRNKTRAGMLRVSDNSVHVQYEDDTTGALTGKCFLTDGELRCGLLKFFGAEVFEGSAEDAVNPRQTDPEVEEPGDYDFDIVRLPFEFDKYREGKPISGMTMTVLAELREAVLAEAEGDAKFLMVYEAATEFPEDVAKPGKDVLIADSCLLLSIREAAGADLLMEFAKQKGLLDDGSEEEAAEDEESEEHPMVGVEVAIRKEVENNEEVYYDIVGVKETKKGLVFEFSNGASAYEHETVTQEEAQEILKELQAAAKKKAKPKALSDKSKKTATQLGLPKAKKKTQTASKKAPPKAKAKKVEPAAGASDDDAPLLVLVGCVATESYVPTAFGLIEEWEKEFQEKEGMPTFAAPFNEGARYVAGKHLEWCIENGFAAFVEKHGNIVTLPRFGSLAECLLQGFVNLRTSYGWNITLVYPGV